MIGYTLYYKYTDLFTTINGKRSFNVEDGEDKEAVANNIIKGLELSHPDRKYFIKDIAFGWDGDTSDI